MFLSYSAQPKHKHFIFLSALFIAVVFSIFVFFSPSRAEAATNVYYSVGQNVSDHKTGSSTVSISGGVATFSIPQTGTTTGIGDKVTYASSVAYISGKISTTQWSLITATGTIPGNSASTSVSSITHAFSSLSTAVATTTGAASSSYLNTTNLVAGGYVLNIPCYYDTGSDTAAVTINGYTTGANNYIRIYTPTSTVSEVNQTQRHSGVWDTNKYRLETTNANAHHTIDNYENYIRFDGLQIKVSISDGGSSNAILDRSTGSTYFSNNIIKGNVTGGSTAIGIGNQASTTEYIWNNICYSLTKGLTESNNTAYIYNNTIYGGASGMYDDSYGKTLFIKDNIAYNNTKDWDITYDHGVTPASTNNLSKDATAPAHGTYYINKTLTFTNTTAGSEDFHLVSGDTDAIDKGVDLSSDTYLPFNTDIDGQTRSGTWEIGADDYYVPPDLELPVVTAFTIPSTATSRTISISSFTASDNVGVTGYKITQSATPPAAGDSGWTGSAPGTYTITGPGTSYTLYAWAKDSAGNVSVSRNASTVITLTAQSCSQADIQSSVNEAQDGDTVLVPAGSCTWTTGNGTACWGGYTVGVCVQKGIDLQGGNGGSTTITFGSGFTRGGLQIFPDASSLSDNATFEVTGFTFDGGGGAMNNEGLLSIRSSATNILHNLKIHDNILTNVTNKAVVVNGAVNGVIYKNTFTDADTSVTAYGDDADGWATFARDYGQADNLFIEDNTIKFTTDMSDSGGTDHGQGAPGFVFRYNTFNLANTTGGSLFTMHGLQTMAVTAGYTCPSGCGYNDSLPSPIGSCDETVAAAAQWSTIKSEYYGNKIINAASLNSYTTQRGSWLMMFDNDVASTGSAPHLVYDQYSCDSSQSPATPAYSQHVQNSYIYDNLYNSSNVSMTKGFDFCGDMSINKPYTITENVDYWNYNSSFNGTTGVGAGPLSSRSATCTTGVGYWVTNQSTTNLTGMVGANPTTPISGTFYKCTSTNTWTSYYTPFVYPHPLTATSTMGTNRVDIGAGARVFGTAKFYNINSVSGNTADISIVPASGTLSNWLDLTVSAWNNTGTREKTWTEGSPNMGGISTAHTIGDLSPNTNYTVKVDGVTGSNITGASCAAGVCTSDSSGKITFTYTGGYSTHTFDVNQAGAITDMIAPTITSFAIPSTLNSLTVSISSFTATDDDSGVAGYLITESASAPASSTSGWTASAPGTFTFSGTGSRTAYAWAKDAAGNISTSTSQTVVITLSAAAQQFYAPQFPSVTNPQVVNSIPASTPVSLPSIPSTNSSPSQNPQGTATSFHVSPLRNPIKLGMSGDEVKNLQQMLSQDREVYPQAKVTGYFGSLTQAAVKKFQLKYNISSPSDPAFGLVGPKTRAKLNELYTTESTVSTVTTTVTSASQLSDIARAQIQTQISQLQQLLVSLMQQFLNLLTQQLPAEKTH